MLLPQDLAYSTTKNVVNHLTTTHGPDQQAAMDRANFITTTLGGGLSIIGVMFIVVSYFKLVKYRAGGTTAQTILLYISLADFLAAASNISSLWFAALHVGHACKAGAFLIIFASTASFFWTSCLAIHLYLILMNKGDLISETAKMLLFHAVSWGLPLLFSAVALGCDALGQAPFLSKTETYIKLTTGGWCWIRKSEDKRKTIAWTMMTSKIWELVSYLLITILCLLMLRQIRLKVTTTDSIGEESLAEARQAEWRMMYIPVAFIVLRIWGTVRYFAYISDLSVRRDVLKNVTLYALQGLGDSGQGFANSIFFCISNKRVCEYWRFTLTNFLPAFLCYNADTESSECSPLLHSLHMDKQMKKKKALTL